MTTMLFTKGYLAEHACVLVWKIDDALAGLGIQPAMIINDVAHYSLEDAERLLAYLVEHNLARWPAAQPLSGSKVVRS